MYVLLMLSVWGGGGEDFGDGFMVVMGGWVFVADVGGGGGNGCLWDGGVDWRWAAACWCDDDQQSRDEVIVLYSFFFFFEKICYNLYLIQISW